MSRPQKLRGALVLLSALLALSAGTGALARASGTAEPTSATTPKTHGPGAQAQLRHAGRACAHPALGTDASSPVRAAAHAAERACRCALLEHRAQLGRRVGPRALARCSSAPQSARRLAKPNRRDTSPPGGRRQPSASRRELSASRREQRAKRRQLRRQQLASRRKLRAERRAARARGRHREAHAGHHNSVAADGSGCEGASLVPSEANLAQVTEATLCLINRERARAGESPLQSNSDLTQAARGHSLSMLQHSYFEHVDPDGRGPLQRVRASGYLSGPGSGYEIGENIAWGSSTLATPASIVAAWMASPGHRANILRPAYRDSGIGIVAQLPGSFGAGSSGAIYTQDFGAIIGG